MRRIEKLWTLSWGGLQHWPWQNERIIAKATDEIAHNEEQQERQNYSDKDNFFQKNVRAFRCQFNFLIQFHILVGRCWSKFRPCSNRIRNANLVSIKFNGFFRIKRCKFTLFHEAFKILNQCDDRAHSENKHCTINCHANQNERYVEAHRIFVRRSCIE